MPKIKWVHLFQTFRYPFLRPLVKIYLNFMTPKRSTREYFSVSWYVIPNTSFFYKVAYSDEKGRKYTKLLLLAIQNFTILLSFTFGLRYKKLTYVEIFSAEKKYNSSTRCQWPTRILSWTFANGLLGTLMKTED